MALIFRKKPKKVILAERRAIYREYLRKPHWKRFSKELRDLFPTCQLCQKRKSREVHHLIYRVNGKSVLFFEHTYDPPVCMAVCKECHAFLDAIRR